MARELIFDGWWSGEVEFYCDECGKRLLIPFTSEEEAKDYSRERKLLKNEGWITTKVNDRFINTCSEPCRNRYIRKNTI